MEICPASTTSPCQRQLYFPTPGGLIVADQEIKPEVLDELLKGVQTQQDLMGPNGLLNALTKGLVERILEGELTHHLGCEKSDPAG